MGNFRDSRYNARMDSLIHRNQCGCGRPGVSIQTIPAGLWSLALRDCHWVRSGHLGNGRHPGVSGEGVAYRGEGVSAVLGGGGGVAADRVPVAGGLLRAGSSPAASPATTSPRTGSTSAATSTPPASTASAPTMSCTSSCSAFSLVCDLGLQLA
jgi:hypothetical protein